MRQSKLFLKTQKEFPKDETAANARLLIRANFIHKLMAGVYSLLPLGLRVRDKIIDIVREEMNALGASELLMPALQPRTAWEATGRWEGLAEIMYQFKDSSGREIGLAPTHEEIAAILGKLIVDSHTDLPQAFYQFQEKFRYEPRAKSGLLRGREFTMKDLYSLHANEESLNDFYEEVKKSYQKIFQKCGLKTFVSEASGGEFSKEYSHEFMVEAQAGEDEIFLCRLCGFSQNKEIAKLKSKARCPKCEHGALDKIKSIEVGNIFKLGTKYSEPIGLTFKDKNGKLHPVLMASYGIGVSRLIGTIVEIHHDEKGIKWPAAVAPFFAHLLFIGEATPDLQKFSDQVYNKLIKTGVEILYDDRLRLSAGEKFFDADLIGLPWRILVSEKTLVQEKIEVKKRDQKDGQLMKVDEFIKLIKT
ncbi:MAG: aminoacyl--tRNA ligase-related protein [Patescibacteria group bacterium]